MPFLLIPLHLFLILLTSLFFFFFFFFFLLEDRYAFLSCGVYYLLQSEIEVLGILDVLKKCQY